MPRGLIVPRAVVGVLIVIFVATVYQVADLLGDLVAICAALTLGIIGYVGAMLVAEVRRVNRPRELDDEPSHERLLFDLSNPDWKIREKAVVKLAEYPDRHTINTLSIMLSDEDEYVKSAAAIVLSILRQPQAIEPLLMQLHHRSWFERYLAAINLSSFGEPYVVEALVNALRDSSGWVWESAAHSLGRIGEPARNPLLNSLDDDDVYVRAGAIIALGQMGSTQAIPPLINKLKDVEIAYKRGEGAWLPPLVEDRVCDIAARALRKIGTPEALAAVEQWEREQKSGG